MDEAEKARSDRGTLRSPDPVGTEQGDSRSPEPPGTPDPGKDMPPPREPVWNFRGYRMQPAEFNTAMVHFYRGEVQRGNTWRTRLDNTTNWAVLTTGAAPTSTLD